jgi:DNA-binding NarL/FixJ family response regulator
MNILLADDHTIVREGIARLLRGEYPFAMISEVNNANDLLRLVNEGDWDVAIVDISMPLGDSGLEAIWKIREERPATRILVLSMHPAAQYAIRAMKAGASGYVTKDSATLELVKAINQIVSGKRYLPPEVADLLADSLANPQPRSLEYLSDRELEVLRFLGGGHTVAEIARTLNLARNTVNTFRARIVEKLHFHNNMELIKFACEHHLSSE